ncbi:MAG: 4-alpha-glucanotransferase, partial [Bifidobacterium crudilactis]|nr:4-alpha-glucanotransferase [Bifidobacterium crudilactis]
MGQNDDYHEIEDEVLVAALKSLGFEASDARQARATLKTLQDARHRELIEPTVFMTAGEASTVPVHAGALDIPAGRIILENGEEYPRSLMPA